MDKTNTNTQEKKRDRWTDKYKYTRKKNRLMDRQTHIHTHIYIYIYTLFCSATHSGELSHFCASSYKRTDHDCQPISLALRGLNHKRTIYIIPAADEMQLRVVYCIGSQCSQGVYAIAPTEDFKDNSMAYSQVHFKYIHINFSLVARITYEFVHLSCGIRGSRGHTKQAETLRGLTCNACILT